MEDQVSSGTGRVTSDCVSDQLSQKNDLNTNLKVAEPRLPQELITEILLWSSVKSLLRFRCVSKSFCVIIDSNHFINLHINRSSKNKKHRRLIGREIPGSTRLHAFDVDNGLDENLNKPCEEISIKPYGYCNGLILLLVDSYTLSLALWNPSTQKFRNLPPCPIDVPKGGRRSIIGMGLGYESTRDEYKVVLIIDVMAKNDILYGLQVWIFGLRSNSWRSIQNFPYRKKDKFIYFGHFVDGCLHWMCKPNEGEYARVEFDVAKETISSMGPCQWFHMDLHVLDGCLCASYFSLNPNKATVIVRKKEGANKFKWITLLTVTPEAPVLFDISRFRNVRVLGYTKQGDKIMLDLGFKFIVLYDLKGKYFGTRKLVDDKDCPGKLFNYPFLCHESLVSVGSEEGGEDLQEQSGLKRKKRD